MTRHELRVVLQGWFCGCGSPELAAARLRDILALYPLYEHRTELEAMIPDAGIPELMLYTLDHFDLTEHGGTVGGAWLSDKGIDVLAALNREAANNFEALEASVVSHSE